MNMLKNNLGYNEQRQNTILQIMETKNVIFQQYYKRQNIIQIN